MSASSEKDQPKRSFQRASNADNSAVCIHPPGPRSNTIAAPRSSKSIARVPGAPTTTRSIWSATARPDRSPSWALAGSIRCDCCLRDQRSRRHRNHAHTHPPRRAIHRFPRRNRSGRLARRWQQSVWRRSVTPSPALRRRKPRHSMRCGTQRRPGACLPGEGNRLAKPVASRQIACPCRQAHAQHPRQRAKFRRVCCGISGPAT